MHPVLHTDEFKALPPETSLMNSLNFEFLRESYEELANLGGFAEAYAYSDQEACLLKLRKYGEFLVKAVYSRQHMAFDIRDKFHDLLTDHSFKTITPPVVLDKLHLLRINGNDAAHGDLQPLPNSKVIELVKDANGLGKWLLVSAGKCQPGGFAPWVNIPEPSSISQDQAQSKSLSKENKATKKKLEQQEALMKKLLEDLEVARAKIATQEKTEEEAQIILNQAQQAASALEFNEETTRRQLIDKHLLNAGWDIAPSGQQTEYVKQEVKILHQPTPSGYGHADYVLYGENGLPLAVIEAKKTATDAILGKNQARCYADGLEKMTGHRPVIFYTNGHDIFIWNDAKKEPPRSLFGFYSKDSLEYDLFQREQRDLKLSALIPRESITDRIYQIEAIKRVSERFDSRKRKALIIQATGTGKTRVAISLCDVMLRAKWAKRILFLCDRRELRKQANGAFEEFLPEEPRVNVSRKTASDRDKRIYFSTYPAMMECFENFDVGFFDLIIADESHRSIYNRYKDLFRYFDSFQVGLTATPVKFVYRNTYGLFECEDGDPTFDYPYEAAITHDPPYLCPYKIIKHTTKFLRKGIKYNELNREQKEQLEDEEAVDDATEVNYESRQLGKKVFNLDTEKTILHNLMTNGIKNADGTHVGKTIIFARSNDHAKIIVETFDKEFPQYGGSFCAMITCQEPRAEQLIDDFKSTDGSSDLTIAVSVDMLDTGIDIPSVVNLVFNKPVKSYAKFWQMVGRGTRLCPDLFGSGQHKEYFQIFDHWGNFEYFDELDKEEDPSTSTTLMESSFETQIALAEAALKKQCVATLKIATTQISEAIADLPENCLSVRDKWKVVQSVSQQEVIEAFHPSTVALLRREILPLMKWRKIDGAEAHRFDQRINKLQLAKLGETSAVDPLVQTITEETKLLPINLKQVEEKIDTINLAKSETHLKQANSTELEAIRTTLRPIMKLKKKITTYTFDPIILRNLHDGEVEYKTHTPKLGVQDLVRYRNRVESVLQALLSTNPTLHRIRNGQPVTQEELEKLTQDVILQDQDLKLTDLLVQFPNDANNLATAIRHVIGLDSLKVDQHFSKFVQNHPTIGATQIRFLDMLKSHIKKNGAIEIDKLYEDPFTSIDHDGIEGVFPDDQIDELLELINQINSDVA